MTTTASYQTVAQQLYVAYFGRPADVQGLSNIEAALAAADVAGSATTTAGLAAGYSTNPALASIVNSFGTSSESLTLYGSTATSAGAQNFVTAVFENLFNRAPLAAGLAFWSEAILSGSLTPGDAALSIAAAGAPADAATLATKVAAATVFTTDLAADGSGGLTAYKGAVAAADGRAFLHGISGATASTVYDAEATSAVTSLVNPTPTPTPTPTPAPAPTPTPTLALTVSGDTIHLNGTTAASTASLTGADLTAFPSATFGTVAQMLTAGVTSVTDSGGNFTLDASGNAHATTFNFGTGAVSGTDAASSAGITYTGVTTYVTSDNADTVTLSAPAQSVIASNDENTVNLGSLAYAGTLNFNAGTGGTDTINATVDGDLSDGHINGTGGNAHIALVLSGAGTETLSTEEYYAIISTTAGSITFTGGTPTTDHIMFSDAGTVALTATVGNYNLFAGINDVTALYSDGGGGGNTFLSTDAITGSGGTNTLTINPVTIDTDTTLVDANFGNGTISGIQDLVFGSTGTGNFSLTTGSNFNADFPTLNLTSETTTGTLTLALDNYVTAATLLATTTTGNQSIHIGTAAGTAVDNVTSHSTTGTIGITVGDGADTITTTSTTGAVTINAGNGADSITATATDGGGSINITTGTGNSSITASSPDAVTITSGSTTGDTISGTADASGALVINANGAATSGIYTITANCVFSADTINVAGGTGTETYNITLGVRTGMATINVSEIGTGAQANAGTYAANTVITGAQSGDVIQIADTTASTFSSLGAEASVNIGIDAAHTSFPGPGNVQTFTYGGNTYLVEDVASNTPLATSTVVELGGAHTIFSVVNGAVTLAS